MRRRLPDSPAFNPEDFAPESTLLQPVVDKVQDAYDAFRSQDGVTQTRPSFEEMRAGAGTTTFKSGDTTGPYGEQPIYVSETQDAASAMTQNNVSSNGQIDAPPSDDSLGILSRLGTKLSKLNPFSEKGFLPGTREEFFKNKLRTEFADLPEAEKTVV